MLNHARHHLRTLPRDSRDTLFMLGVIAWVLLPQGPHLPLWCSALAGAVLLWRGWLAVALRPMPSPWWLRSLLVLTLVATYLTHQTLLGRDAGVTLIVVMLTLKTMELRAKRDAFVVFFIGFFTMLTNFFYSQSLLTAVAMLVALLGLLTALVNAHMPVGKPPLRLAAKTAGGMALLGAPIMVVLFLLFPRMAPLWGIPGDAMSGRSGLSATMQVGSVASLALDDSIALRVRFEGAPPAQADLYFRGPVLSTFDGREWRTLRSGLPARLQPKANLAVQGPPVNYQVTLEPNQRPWLLLLDATPVKPALYGMEARMTSELQWVTNSPVTDMIRYSAQSFPNFSHGPVRPVAGLQDYLNLPDGFNPRTLQLAADLRRDPRYTGADGAQWVTAAMDRLRSGGYSYTLDPGIYGRHTADEFWFDRKEGFCEHIASSFVILMRALEVPARLVTGYQGGTANSIDGYWTVRQRDAHAWAEVWLAGRGWVRVDPTSAVAPGRVGTPATLAGTAQRAGQCFVGQHQPGLRPEPACGVGRHEQQLEPARAELHAGQTTELAEKPRLRVAALGRPDLPAERPVGRRESGGRGLDAVGAPAPRPLAAAAGRRPSPSATSRHHALTNQPAARHGRATAPTSPVRPARLPSPARLAAAPGSAALRTCHSPLGAPRYTETRI
jgi:transglutaminase-like putative cysteine protease